MSGIVFMRTRSLDDVRVFYTERLAFDVWLDQVDCLILRHGNLLIGFCKRDAVDCESTITLFYRSREEVDEAYIELEDIADSKPVFDDKYRIYRFFANDPEGRRLEFQYFDHAISEHLSGDQLMLTRRSVRDFDGTEVTDDIIYKVLELSRYAPTSHNAQSYYFRIIRDDEILARLSQVRGSFSQPIAKSGVAVAVCSDPGLTKRCVQDGCIAAYHFILSAWHYGLGTCWIAAMDRDDVKKLIGIPQNHYIATVTPVGFPLNANPNVPERKPVSWFVR